MTTKNRIFPMISAQKTNIDSFTAFSSFASSPPFSGLDVPALIETARRQSFVEGFKEGQTQTVKTIDKIITNEIDKFILINTKIIDFVKKILEEYKVASLELAEARVNFNHLTSGIISILFIIDTDIENELWMASLLSSLSKKVLDEDKYITELRFINQRGKKLDRNLVESEFPLQRIFNK